MRAPSVQLLRVVILAAVALAGCLVVDDRLYACTEEGQCERGSSCVQGLCVPLSLDGGAVPDGGEVADAGVSPDGGSPDGGEQDAGAVTDAGEPVPDAGQPDAGEPDEGTGDGGVEDAGTVDAGLLDAGVDAGAPWDAGTVPDGGFVPQDAGVLPGDLCGEALPLTLDPQTGNATVVDTLAGTAGEYDLCGGEGPDRFYVVSARGSLTASAVALDGGSVKAAIMTSCQAALSATCSGSTGANQSYAMQYVVAVTSPGEDADAFRLDLSGTAPSQGDSCAEPLVLMPLTSTGKTSNLTENFSGITQGHTERENPCGGMFNTADRRDMVFALDVQATGTLRVTVDPTASSFFSMPDVGLGLSVGGSCGTASPVGVCVNAKGTGNVETHPDLPVTPGTYFIWVSIPLATSGTSTRATVTARLM